MPLPRLRQAVLVARDLGATCTRLEEALGLRAPYADPGVAEFGLTNAVYEIGDTFLEVVSPARPGTAAGRYLDKNGGDGGYMAIFQVADIAEARNRIVQHGGRIVWSADLPDISGTHIHPKDTPGAIVSIDEARPAESWHWAGPRWTGGTPADATGGGIEEIVVAVDDVDLAAVRWRAFVGGLPGVRFATGAGRQGIVEIVVRMEGAPAASVDVGSATVRTVG